MGAQLIGEELDVRDAMQVVWRHRGRIGVIVLVASVLAFGIASVMPKSYRASVVLLPPQESDLLSNISLAQRALTKFPAFGILNDYFTPADVYKAILGSRSVGDEIAARFDLAHTYHLKSREKTLKVLRGVTRVKLNPDGTIQVSVDDRDPRRAADMANAYIEALDRFNVETRNTSAHRTRVFLEQRVTETDSLLRGSELLLRTYQERHHAVAPTSVGGADVQSAADLMSRKIQLEVHLGVLRSYLREDNDQVVQVRSELTQLQDKMAALPALQNDLQRLTRNAKVQEQVYLMLTAELEQARVQETMNTPTVEVMDRAVPPERQVWPKRLLITLVAALVAALAAASWYAITERESRPPVA